MVALSESGETFVILVIVKTIKSKAKFAKQLWCKVGGSNSTTFREVGGN